MSSVYHFNERKKLAGLDSISVLSNAGSMNLTSVDKSSPYSRIFSNNNVRAHNLPNFMIAKSRQKGLTLDDLRRVDLKAIPSRATSPERYEPPDIEETLASVVKSINRLYFIKSPSEIETGFVRTKASEILNGVLSAGPLRIKNREIPLDELHKLAKDKDLSKNIINVFMQHLKQVAKVALKFENSKIRVNITTAEFSDFVLLKGNLIKQQGLSLDACDYLIFPVFHHYWKLVVHDILHHKAIVYDLGHNDGEAEMLIENLKNFWKFNSQPVEDLTVELMFEKGIHLWSSGIFISKITKNLVLGLDTKTCLREISDYRIEMLLILLKLSQVNLVSI